MCAAGPELIIDGSLGEGGGQILRTSLALSLVTGRPFRMVKIRARRKKPGLMRQHRTAVEAAVRIGGARVEGAEIGSTELRFEPAGVIPGDYEFLLGGAGSTMLVLQAVLPALLTGGGVTRLKLHGGTHNPLAPPFEFVERSFLPVVARMGPRLEARLLRSGFFPAGAGTCEVEVHPARRLSGVELLDRGDVRSVRVRAVVARLPRQIAERELTTVRRGLDRVDALEVVEVPDSLGPGNVVQVEVACERVTEVFTAFGERGRRAEEVAEAVVRETRRWLDAGVPVGEHLADQLLVPMALAGSGEFRTLRLSSHATTNVEVVERFLDVRIAAEEESAERWRVRVERR